MSTNIYIYIYDSDLYDAKPQEKMLQPELKTTKNQQPRTGKQITGARGGGRREIKRSSKKADKGTTETHEYMNQ